MWLALTVDRGYLVRKLAYYNLLVVMVFFFFLQDKIFNLRVYMYEIFSWRLELCSLLPTSHKYLY